MKLPPIIVSGLVVAGGLLLAGEPLSIDAPFLSSLRAEAASNHPSALAGIDRAKAAANESRSVRLWNDPMLGLGFMSASRMMRADDGDIMIGIEQPLPKPGMLAAESARAIAIQRAELEKAAASGNEAGARAARAAIELALADESIALQEEQIRWLEKMAENARQLAVKPAASVTDALRMETELERERQMLEAARRSRAGYSGILNLALGRSLEKSWPTLSLPLRPLPVPVAHAEVARIPHVNPEVRAMKEMASAASAETRIADRDRLPEFTLGADAQLFSGTGDIKSTTIGLKLTLPWFNDRSYQARIDAASSREAAAHRDIEAMQIEVAAMVVASCADAANSASQARALGAEILTKAAKAADSTEAAWISSKAPLNDLLDSARILFSIRLEQRRMIARQLAALEDLNVLVPTR